MKVKIIHEYGIHEAMLGLGLSFGKTSDIELEDILYKDDNISTKMFDRMNVLAGLGNGHDKFLRAINVVLDITAPLYWWKEFDTYKIGTVTQSESTMHTLTKKSITKDMFEDGDSIYQSTIDQLEQDRLNNDFYTLNKNLPHSFLQRRIVSTNYAVLANIIKQRNNHKLPEWVYLCDVVKNQINHPNFLK